jgi:hypothetical protein
MPNALEALLAARSLPLPPPPPPEEDWIREMTRDASRYSGTYKTTLSPPEGPLLPITIDEDMATIGTRVWDCSVLMSHQFLHHSTLLSSSLVSPPPNLLNLSNRTVVEIGSGCGLLPIALSKLPSNAPSKIVATEYLPSIITHLENQVEKNGASVDVRKLDWFCTSDVVDCSSSSDTILMSDCTLDPSESPVILDAIEEVRRRMGEGTCRDGPRTYATLRSPLAAFSEVVRGQVQENVLPCFLFKLLPHPPFTHGCGDRILPRTRGDRTLSRARLLPPPYDSCPTFSPLLLAHVPGEGGENGRT